MTLPAGVRLGAYEILSPLGAGGMGEVYRARDGKLDRDVAIKVLPQSVATDPVTLARFEREAKAVAALSHPNILSIFDFGTHEGTAYAVMELLEGETLRGKLDAGPISQKQAVDYTLQIAKGLAAAHERAIVHRDLKPENLFVSRDGHLKILDFGLAKRVEAVAPGQETSAPTGSGHTEPGTVMGTVGYMSPEQVKGLPVDHRSDIFSLGVILYELLSGQKAFRRATNAETMAAIMRDEPPELSESGRNISPALDRVVRHCLEKDRDHRFQSARDIAFNLSDPSAPEPASRAAKGQAPAVQPGFRIAVLPFKCATADGEVLALADGLCEEIVSGLSRFRYLSVVASASTSLSDVRGNPEAPAGARYLIEGSIRREASALRVGAQLVDTRTGARLWSETYRRDMGTAGAFAVQDDVAGRVVATVADGYGVLVHSIRDASGQKDDADLTPVEWQFRYFAYREQISPASHDALRSRLKQAVERNDRPSDLWACLAQVYVDEYSFGFGGDATSLDRALAAARRAVELDRANQFALVALAQVHFFRQDLAAFGPAAERAMALNPLNTDAVGILGLQIVHTGEFARGATIVRRAMELNPNHAGWMHFAPLWEHFHKGEYEQALERANRVDVPGHFWPFLVVASACGHLGRRAEAAAAVRDLLALDPEFAAHARSNVATWHFASGLMDPILDGLRKAGLAIPATDDSRSSSEGTITAEAERASLPASGKVRAEEGFWVAVLPFRHAGAGASLASLAEGLTEEIVTGLSRFSYLRVISRGSTAHDAVDARSAGKELGARYVMEGSLRQAGTVLRLAVQLVDATTGAHLWAESFERAFRPESIFELQDDLVPRIVSTVADMAGVLPRSMSAVLRSRPPQELSPYEAVLRSFAYFERYNPEELTAARSGLEAALRNDPGYADAWAMLSILDAQDYVHGYELRADALEAAASAARRAVQLGPSNHLAYFSLAQSLSYQKELDSFRDAAERAVELNPMDGNSVALIGELLTYAGSADRGMQLAERAKRLNPSHPGWYWYADFYHAFSQGDYRGALGFALKVNLRGNPLAPMFIAAACGQLGETDQGSKAARDLLKFRPELPGLMPQQVAKIWNPEYGERFLEGLRKAGLEIPSERQIRVPVPAPVRSSAAGSGTVGADEGFWIAVLPFRSGGGDASLADLAEGMTDEIVTGLTRFSYLRVISRSSTRRFAGGTAEAQAVGLELDARYVLEGNVRQAGARLRITVKLVESSNGAQLWSETYEQEFRPDAVFEIQDALVPRIVSTVADMHGVLPRTMSDALRHRAPDSLSPYEAVLRSFGYFERVTAEDLAASRSALELAVRTEPANADAWAMLALLCDQDYGQGFGLQRDSREQGFAAARRAVDLAPTSHLAHFALAQALFFAKQFDQLRHEAERTISLNPMDGNSLALLAEMLAYSGDWERGLSLAARARELNPHHPGWYWYVPFNEAYRRRDYRGALEFALRIGATNHWGAHLLMAAVHAQLGDREAASRALQDLLRLRPDVATDVVENTNKWFDPEHAAHFVDGLRKAGLQVGGEPRLSRPRDAAVAIAVLPFSDMSAAKDQDYLCEGMAEEIINALVRVDGIRIASRTSAFRAGREGGDLAAIAHALSVGHVLEGSVRTSGSRLRVTAQLTEVASGSSIWSERFDREAADVFAVQDEIAAGVVEAVKIRLAPGAHAVHARPQARNLEAYRSYLKGRHLRGIEDHAGALRAFEEAVRLDPSHAPSWTGLAEITVLSAHFSIVPAREACAAARRALATAEELQGESAEGLHVEAFAAYIERRWDAMEQAWRRALELEPRHVLSLGSFGITLCARGKVDEGLALCERSREADPLASFPYTLTAWGMLLSGRPDEALRYAADALGFAKEDASALIAASMAHVALGRFEEGIAEAQQGVAISHRGPAFLGGLGWALASAGRIEEARALLAELRARPATSPTTVSEAWLLGALGEIDEAFEVVARAEEECQGQLYYTGLPAFDALRSDPRFAALERRLGLLSPA